MVEAWEIRGWSLKVQEEPLSTGSSQNESCYLILLSTLLRFIRQLFDALQYATNRARIVCRRRSLSFPLSIFLPVGILHLSPSRFRFLYGIYTSDNMYTRIYIFVSTQSCHFLAISYYLKFFTCNFFIDTIAIAVFTNKIPTTMIVLCTLSRNYINFNV